MHEFYEGEKITIPHQPNFIFPSLGCQLGLTILFVSKWYILVKNFAKNVQKGGRGGVIANPKTFIANLCMSYEFSGKKCNVISKKGRGGGGGGQGRLEVFQKTSIFAATVTPKLVAYTPGHKAHICLIFWSITMFFLGHFSETSAHN